MARKRNQGSNWIRRDKRLAIYLRDGLACVYCGAGVEDGALLTLDHVVAVESGGSNAASNLVTACRSCNSSKCAQPLDSWLYSKSLDVKAVSARISILTGMALRPYRIQARELIARRSGSGPIANIAAK